MRSPHEQNTVKVPEDAPLELLGPLGCGIQTGAGAVMNSLRPQAGESIAVFGAGSVGLSAVMAARLVDLYMKGRFPFDKLVKYYPLQSIQQAVEDTESGKVLKAIVTP